MCHAIPITERIELQPDAVPLAELLLTKLQIVELNAKDQSDIITMLYHHDVGEGDDGVINAKRVAQLCAADWGLWRTTKMNVERTRQALGGDEPARRCPRCRRAEARAAVGGDRGGAEVESLEDAEPRRRQGALVRAARRGRLMRQTGSDPVWSRAGAQRDVEVDPVLHRGQVAARQLLDPVQAVAQGVHVHVQCRRGLLPAAAGREEPVERLDQA